MEYPGEERPWGLFKILYETPACKVKEMVIKPGGRVSYQQHAKRHEHWFIVEGQAVVTIDGKERIMRPGESIDIPAGVKHRIGNGGAMDVKFIEIQTGTYFGEDDIIRFSDDYNRIGN